MLAGAAGIGSFAIIGRPHAATPYKPSDSLIDAAKKEGKFLLYTATFTEVEQEVINEFRKKFPFIRIEMIRAPGGQLIQRVKTEAAAGKLAADLVLHSDRGADARDRESVRRLRAAERQGLPPGRARLAEALAEHYAGLVHRLPHRACEKSAEDLDGSHQAGIRRAGRSRR